MHNVFLSYEFRHDAMKAEAVRSTWLAQGGTATLESVRAETDSEVKLWIDRHIARAAATVVLVGRFTASSRWVMYEIQRSKSLGKGLLGVDVSGILVGPDPGVCSPMPMLAGYALYDWVRDGGEHNLASWVAKAIRTASTQ